MMQRRALVLVALLGGARAASAADAFDLEPGTRVLAPVRFRQLAVLPVVASASLDGDAQYLTLADGLAHKAVRVSEAGDGGDVNRVTVANRSDRPLLLLGGEIILGGQQDRILGKDTVVPAHERMSLEVFCVEHGRWSGRREFTRTGGLVEGRTRLRAKFRSNQAQVWAEVAQKTRALGAQSSTGSYGRLAVGAAGERAVAPYREAVGAALDKLPEAKQMVGLIAAVNGRVSSVDLFANPRLFAAYRERLLDSIYLTAADVAPAKDVDPAPSPAAVKAFIGKAEAAKETEVAASRASRTVEKKAPGVAGSTLLPAVAPAAAAPPKPVYKSYQADE
jgi:hypothetical protein